MGEAFDALQQSVGWVADTGLFIACGRQQIDILHPPEGAGIPRHRTAGLGY